MRDLAEIKRINAEPGVGGKLGANNGLGRVHAQRRYYAGVGPAAGHSYSFSRDLNDALDEAERIYLTEGETDIVEEDR